jgi:hypothetical protein
MDVGCVDATNKIVFVTVEKNIFDWMADGNKQCNPTVSTKRLFSIMELAAEIGGTKWFWRSQIWDGEIPFVQVGKKMFVDRYDIDS